MSHLGESAGWSAAPVLERSLQRGARAVTRDGHQRYENDLVYERGNGAALAVFGANRPLGAPASRYVTQSPRPEWSGRGS
jgi:hypothetical protein